MDKDLNAVERSILMSGVDDWVYTPEIVGYARIAIKGASDTEILSLAVSAIKHLAELRLIEVGDVDTSFHPWAGQLNEIITKIDDQVRQVQEPSFGDMFWVSNTAAGDEIGQRFYDLGELPLGVGARKP